MVDGYLIIFLTNGVNFHKPVVHYQNLFRLFIKIKKRKGAIKIFIKTVSKAQENQRFSMVTKLKLRAIKHNYLTTNYLRIYI